MRLTEEFVLGTAAGGQHCFNVFIIGQDLDRSFDTVQHNREYRIPRYNSSSERHPRSPIVRQYGPPACHRSLYFLRQRVVASHLPPPCIHNNTLPPTRVTKHHASSLLALRNKNANSIIFLYLYLFINTRGLVIIIQLLKCRTILSWYLNDTYL